MYQSFDTLPDSARVWIYQSNRSLDFGEVEAASAVLMNFCADWKSHGTPVKASLQVFHNRFMVLAVDETDMAGCSIDSSVGVIRTLEERFGITLLDRMQVAVRVDGLIWTLPLREFKQKVAEGELTPDTMLFNNLIQTKGELATAWEIPLRESWASALAR